MTVDSRHPEYDNVVARWQTMRDTAGCEVKSARETYLPRPSGFRAMDDGGNRAYADYLQRAQFPDIVGPTVRGMVGVIHRTETQIVLPDALQALWEKATKDGLSLEAFHRRITRELLTTGRYGVLVDAASEPKPGDNLPFFASYRAESIINWADKTNDFFVLDESGRRRNGFLWEDDEAYRVLELSEGRYVVRTYKGKTQAESQEITPNRRGGGALTEIPFVLIGATEIRNEIGEIPLIGVADHALAIYRLDADYRHQLYMTGQETLFVSGGGDKKPEIIGAGVVHMLPQDGKAYYVGPSGTGIAAHRQAIQDEREAAVVAGARLFDRQGSQAESGEAKRIRYASQTATLTSIALSSAQGLERALRHAAVMVGANPDDVVVKPNLSFIDATLSPSDANGIVSLWQKGAIAKQTMYENLQKGEIASSERSFEEEQQLIEDEMPRVPSRAA